MDNCFENKIYSDEIDESTPGKAISKPKIKDKDVNGDTL